MLDMMRCMMENVMVKGKGKGGAGCGDNGSMPAIADMGGEQSTGPTRVAEVRYVSPMHAQSAVESLNGSSFHGGTLNVLFDQFSKDGTKLIVSGVPAGVGWMELKEHFKAIGSVAFAGFKDEINSSQKGKGGGGGGDDWSGWDSWTNMANMASMAGMMSMMGSMGGMGGDWSGWGGDWSGGMSYGPMKGGNGKGKSNWWSPY
mmetsp:Transcript_43301/g.114032  ORF Transcript_43301/g.114032 Transcript_43301/m.114032 type:complete len:202 (+) Transcript_43301:3-608(+)